MSVISEPPLQVAWERAQGSMSRLVFPLLDVDLELTIVMQPSWDQAVWKVQISQDNWSSFWVSGPT